VYNRPPTRELNELRRQNQAPRKRLSPVQKLELAIEAQRSLNAKYTDAALVRVGNRTLETMLKNLEVLKGR
jgi:hypothetical protein